MGAWAFMLGGLVVWAVHFLGVYGVASVADVAGRADMPASLWSVAALTLACAAADGVLLAAAFRRLRSAPDPLAGFTAGVAALGAGVSLVAVAWQGLPAALVG